VIKTNSYLLVVLGMLLASCSAILPEPTATPAPTATPSPTETPLPPTPTLTSTPTLTPRPTLDLATRSAPAGTPEKEWNGITIMPGALAGEGDLGFYRFTINATSAEIQAYYKRRLAALGWTSFASGTSETGTLLLIFTKETQTVPKKTKTLSVSIIPFDDLFIVMLIK
jgi:hypothetical protein